MDPSASLTIEDGKRQTADGHQQLPVQRYRTPGFLTAAAPGTWATDARPRLRLVLAPSPVEISTISRELGPKGYRSVTASGAVYNCALVADENITVIKGDFDGNPMSSIDGRRLGRTNLIEVTARTLQSILNEVQPPKIDFLSLDVEGYELQALRGTDFSIYTPVYVLIEIYTWELEQIKKLMEKADYELLANLSGFNRISNPGWDGSHNDYLFKFKGH